jgi:DNA-directed RNA polymerase sigma subunit (sigma70/sigma32)
MDDRLYTHEEGQWFVRAYLDYVPAAEMAKTLGCSVSAIHQRASILGLRRSASVTRVLQWAPEELRVKRAEMTPAAFVEYCHAWQRQPVEQKKQNKQLARQWRQAEASIIDDDKSLSRDAKIVAKRALGMTLEEIGLHHGLSCACVHWITTRDESDRRRSRDRHLSRNAEIMAKRTQGMTLKEIGLQYGLTRERVRQITAQDR